MQPVELHQKEKIMKKLMLTLFAASIVLVGCNTVAGVGQDVQKGGEAVENAADRVHHG